MTGYEPNNYLSLKNIWGNGVTMRRTVLLISCFLVFVLGCNLFSSADAVTFDIGTKISESDSTYFNDQFYYYSSGSTLHTHMDYEDDIQLLFDNNTSTGINKNYGPGHSAMWIFVFFPYPYYVSNITVKPIFSGKATNYTLSIFCSGPLLDSFGVNMNVQKKFHVNCTITGIRLLLDNDGTNHFYFNDVIINYTINLTDLNSVNQALNILQNSINFLQTQINDLNAEIIELRNFVMELNNTINSINDTINNLNQTQKQILENLTTLWTIYKGLNSSFNQLKNEIDNLNGSIYQNITQLENAIVIIEQDIKGIQNNIGNLTLDTNQIPGLQDQINKTINDLNNLNNNLTALSDSIPSAYDDTTLSTRVIQLESENANHKLEIDNLTSEIDTLTAEISDLNLELDNLKSDFDELQDKDDEEDDDGDEDINALAYGGIGLGILGIIIALAAIGMLLKKKSPPKMPTKAREEPIQQVITEQPQITETAVQTTEAQPQIPSQPLEQLPSPQEPPPMEGQQ